MNREQKQDYMREYNARYRETHREKLLVDKKEWYADNRERMSERAKERRDEILVRRQAADAADPTWAVARNLATNLRQRAKANGLSYDKEMVVTSEIRDWIVRQPSCPCCENAFVIKTGCGRSERSPSLDRFDLRFGYSRRNTKLICWRCNTVKKDKTASQLRNLALWKPESPLARERKMVALWVESCLQS